MTAINFNRRMTIILVCDFLCLGQLVSSYDKITVSHCQSLLHV